ARSLIAAISNCGCVDATTRATERPIRPKPLIAILPDNRASQLGNIERWDSQRGPGGRRNLSLVRGWSRTGSRYYETRFGSSSDWISVVTSSRSALVNETTSLRE